MPLPRCVVAEELDELAPGDPRAQGSRRDLRRIHRAMGSLGSLKHAMGRLSMARRPTTLIELGAGDGSLMLRLARALGPAWSGVQLTLLDRQQIVDPGTLRAFDLVGWHPTVVCEDALEWARAADGARYDLCCISLFLHHFDDESLAALLGGIASRSDAVIAIEPRRDALAAMGSRLVGFLGANAITRGDAIKSVAAGFTAGEISARWPTGAGWWTDEFRAWPFSHVFLAMRLRAREESLP